MTMILKSILKKSFVFCTGLLFTLALLEICLRVSAIDAKTFAREKKRIFSDYTIMALGNSYTYGSGANIGEDYPTQLENILNTVRNKKYSVINRGLRNINTTFIAENIEQWLKEDKPDLVFLMIGEPNDWNRYGYWDFLKKKNIPKKTSLLEESDSFLRNFKTFKLIELLLNYNNAQINTEFNYSNTFRGIVKSDKHEDKIYLGYLWIGSLVEENNFAFYSLPEYQAKEAIEMLTYVWEKDKNPEAARLIAEYYAKSEKNFEKALEYLEKGIDSSEFYCLPCSAVARAIRDLQTENAMIETLFKIEQKNRMKKNFYLSYGYPNHITSIENNNQLSMKEKIDRYAEIQTINPGSPRLFNRIFDIGIDVNPEKALKAMKTILKVNPLAVSGDVPQKVSWLMTKHPYLKNEAIKLFTEINIKFKAIDLNKIQSIESLIEEWVIHDLNRIIASIQKTGAKIVIQTYPKVRLGPPRKVDLLLRRWWSNRKEKSGMVFMDVNELLYKKLEQEGDSLYAVHLGPTDNHLNGKGYLEIAKLMEGFVPK